MNRICPDDNTLKKWQLSSDMKHHLKICCLFLMALSSARSSPLSELQTSTVQDAFAGRDGVFYMVDCSSGVEFDSNPDESSKGHAPCSTFKIWNALGGFELGLISDPNEPFYTWDGVPRKIEAWNKDLTLREAFQVSCVPAFQDLARRIGKSRMGQWIKMIGYGDEDISSGIDVFWLPAEGRKTILISPRDQASLLRKLITGQMSISEKSVSNLKELMEVKRTDKAVLYGKTGTPGSADMGWFVGMLEYDGKTYAFSCLLKGKNTTGKDARAAVEKILNTLTLL